MRHQHKPGEPLAIPARCQCGCGQFARHITVGQRALNAIGFGPLHGVGRQAAYRR